MSMDEGEELHVLDDLSLVRETSATARSTGRGLWRSEKKKDQLGQQTPRMLVFVQVSTESSSIDALSRDLHDL